MLEFPKKRDFVDQMTKRQSESLQDAVERILKKFDEADGLPITFYPETDDERHKDAITRLLAAKGWSLAVSNVGDRFHSKVEWKIS